MWIPGFPGITRWIEIELPGNGQPPVLLIAGPTASGKSALALALAEAYRGTVINGDSMQVYRDLRILTARPDEQQLARAPHRLYGYLDAAERNSVAEWRVRALREIADAQAVDRLPIVVGGTGLYLRALQHGLASVPEIPAAIRSKAVELYRRLGGAVFRERLADADPVAAARLPANDRQRLIRAFEVVSATGTPLHQWQANSDPTTGDGFASILLLPPRQMLYAACENRFRAMIAAGGRDELEALAARNLDPQLPAMKALGIPQLLRHLRGEITAEEAILLAVQATRRYAKRQMTWFRHQMIADLTLTEQFSESLLRCSCHFIDGFLLTGRG